LINLYILIYFYGDIRSPNAFPEDFYPNPPPAFAINVLKALIFSSSFAILGGIAVSYY
jgi:hypothetical protein